MGNVFKSTEPAGNAHIIKIKLWWFYKPLFNITVKRGEQIDNITRLQNSNPFTGCAVADSGIIGKIAQVEQLSCSAGTEGHKSLEQAQIFYIYKLPQIPLNISLKIISIGLPEIEIPSPLI